MPLPAPTVPNEPTTTITVLQPTPDIPGGTDRIGHPGHPDSAQAETVLYPCGTIALGQYEPCAHSQVQVLCCSCAGCQEDLWNCGRQNPRPRWDFYEAPFLSSLLGDRTGLWIITLSILVFFCTYVPEWILYGLYVIALLAAEGLIMTLVHLAN